MTTNIQEKRERNKIAVRKYRQTHLEKTLKSRRKRYYKNREKELQYHKQYRQNPVNKEKMKILGRECHLKKKFGLTSMEYKKMFDEQGGICPICKRMEKDNGKDGRHFAVDHNHKTGKIRGLLCAKCNETLGYIEKDDRLTKILKYLGVDK